jgi:hypothetical protein
MDTRKQSRMRNTITLISVILFLYSCTSSNSNQDKNQDSSNNTSELNGVLCYPSDYYIPEMTVYLRQTNSDKVYKLTTKENQSLFKFKDIPFGEYCCYAYTLDSTIEDTNGIKTKAIGGYTKAVPCGLTIDCNDHTLINFKIDSISSKDTISICDFYGAIVPNE